MDYVLLYHHGIKGMKWGVRRTPEQLGHVKRAKSNTGQNGGIAKKTSGKSYRKSTSIGDDELKRRIDRLNLEERYDDLVARQKKRNENGFVSTSKRLVGEAVESFGRQLLMGAATKLANKILDGKKDDSDFDITKYKDMNVEDMDADVVSKLAKYYGDQLKVISSRKQLQTKSADQKKANDVDDHAEKSDKSSSKTKSADTSDGAEDAIFTPTKTASDKLPWMYRQAGTAEKKEADRIQKERDKRDKKHRDWLV